MMEMNTIQSIVTGIAAVLVTAVLIGGMLYGCMLNNAATKIYMDARTQCIVNGGTPVPEANSWDYICIRS